MYIKEPAEVSNHYIHPQSGFTQLYVDVGYLYILFVVLFIPFVQMFEKCIPPCAKSILEVFYVGKLVVLPLLNDCPH